MYQSLPALLLMLGLTVGPSFGDEPNATALKQSNGDTSTLRLYFAPEVANAHREESSFEPEVARLFVDDVFVGNAIVNLHGHLPTLRFGAGAHTVRVELDERKFQSKVTFLGRGSTQILFVNFETTAAEADEVRQIEVPSQENVSPAKKVVAEELRDSLLGAWVLVGEPGTDTQPKPGARMKFWGHRHWAITQSDPDTGQLVFHHGGTYTLDGDKYEETIEFAADNTKHMIGQSLKFKIKVEGDTYVQTGIGNPFTEQWQRLKAE